ncbi:MAG: hypothetical protein Ct9H300mP16_02930 [Pseudomonadota bacterium]|nr:MAG: hypothetical protein Ct9H300mP16_02930 [Pseudomonadota bacterium]
MTGGAQGIGLASHKGCWIRCCGQPLGSGSDLLKSTCLELSDTAADSIYSQVVDVLIRPRWLSPADTAARMGGVDILVISRDCRSYGAVLGVRHEDWQQVIMWILTASTTAAEPWCR